MLHTPNRPARPAPTPVELVVGDTRNILPTLPSGLFDAVITDPPYGLTAQDRSVEAIHAWKNGDDWFMPAGKGLVGCEWDEFVPPPGLWAQVIRVLKPGAPAAVFSSPRTLDLMCLSMQMAGFTLVGVTALTNGQAMPKSIDVHKHLTRAGHPPDMADRWTGWGSALKIAQEPVLIMQAPGGDSRAAAGWLHQVGSFRYVPKATAKERPAVTGPDGTVSQHPSVKPVAGMRWLVDALTAPGQKVLEPFAGSGTTLEACAELGRRCVGVERDLGYVELIRARLSRAGADTVAAA